MPSPYTPDVTGTVGLNGITLHDFTHRISRSGTRHAVIACDTVDAQLQGLPTGVASETVLALLIESLRSTDAATRTSDGVFLVLLDRVRDLADAVSVAQRVSEAFLHPGAVGTARDLCCGVTSNWLSSASPEKNSSVGRATSGRVSSSPLGTAPGATVTYGWK